jgi:hypothetical protein
MTTEMIPIVANLDSENRFPPQELGNIDESLDSPDIDILSLVP